MQELNTLGLDVMRVVRRNAFECLVGRRLQHLLYYYCERLHPFLGGPQHIATEARHPYGDSAPKKVGESSGSEQRWAKLEAGCLQDT